MIFLIQIRYYAQYIPSKGAYASEPQRRVRDFCPSLSDLSQLWISRVGPASFKYGRAVGSETTKTPSTLQACSFLSNPFLEFCLSTPAFFFIILFHMFLQAFDKLQTPWSTYRLQCSFFTGNHFHIKWSTNPRVTSILSTATIFHCALHCRLRLRDYFSKCTSIFCVLIRPRQSLHTVCFRIFAAPVVWSILEIAVLRPPRVVSIVQSFLKASSSSRVRSSSSFQI